MKKITITNRAYKGLKILKEELSLKNESEAIISVIHTAISIMYIDNYKPENPAIRKLEKAIGWKIP